MNSFLGSFSRFTRGLVLEWWKFARNREFSESLQVIHFCQKKTCRLPSTNATADALLLRGLLYGVTAYDPIAFILTPLILGGTAYIACYFPASRASRLDPLIVLREE